MACVVTKMTGILNKLVRWGFYFLPNNPLIFKLCLRYVDRFQGDNNSDPEKNGEYIILRHELSKGGVVFDVGANVGNWASFALSINPALELHVFEPSKRTFSKLISRSWPPNVKLNNIGLGKVEQTLELNIFADNSGMSSVYTRKGIGNAVCIGKERINVTTIDNYCEGNNISLISYIKIDVEGHELAVLKGLKRMLTQSSVQTIQFEYGGCNLDARVYLSDIWDFLEPYGFMFYKLFPEGPRQVDKYDRSLESFKYSNWIATLKRQKDTLL